jgi:hypothetical protein
VILELKLLLIPIISSGSETITDNGYQQWYICNDSETITDDSFEPLHDLLYSSGSVYVYDPDHLLPKICR